MIYYIKNTILSTKCVPYIECLNAVYEARFIFQVVVEILSLTLATCLLLGYLVITILLLSTQRCDDG